MIHILSVIFAGISITAWNKQPALALALIITVGVMQCVACVMENLKAINESNCVDSKKNTEVSQNE